MSSQRSEIRELSIEVMNHVSGSGIRVPVTALAGAKLPGGSGPHRQPIDPQPSLGTDYSGDSAGGDGSGGYMGDGNYLRPF